MFFLVRTGSGRQPPPKGRPPAFLSIRPPLGYPGPMPSDDPGALALPDPTGHVQGARLTRNQAAYLVAIASGAPTQRAACEAAGVHEGQPSRWRATNAGFREAEVAAWQAALSAFVPTALVSLKRLLVADLEHGAAGLAAVGRAVDRVLEGAGITGGRGQSPATVTVNLQPLAHVPAATDVQRAAPGQAPSPLPILDADWAELAEDPATS